MAPKFDSRELKHCDATPGKTPSKKLWIWRFLWWRSRCRRCRGLLKFFRIFRTLTHNSSDRPNRSHRWIGWQLSNLSFSVGELKSSDKTTVLYTVLDILKFSLAVRSRRQKQKKFEFHYIERGLYSKISLGTGSKPTVITRFCKTVSKMHRASHSLRLSYEESQNLLLRWTWSSVIANKFQLVS